MVVEDATLDLSGYQHQVDFVRVRGAGIRLLIHKASQGDGGVQPRYAPREQLARGQGLAWGAYAYMTRGPAGPQVDALVRATSASRGALVACDAELLDDQKRPALRTADIRDWVERASDVIGRRPLLYSYQGYLDGIRAGDDPVLRECPLWLARVPADKGPPAYHPELSIGDLPHGWAADQVLLWQYTWRGIVDGISGDVDRSVGNVDRILNLYPAARAA